MGNESQGAYRRCCLNLRDYGERLNKHIYSNLLEDNPLHQVKPSGSSSLLLSVKFCKYNLK